jgi:hypothetical protein
MQQWETHLHDLQGKIPKFLEWQCVTGATEFAPSE